MRRILVTGYAGFIGSAFLRMLYGATAKKYPIATPEFVAGIDAFHVGSSEESYESLKNIPAFQQNSKLYKGNITDRSLIERILSDHKIDTVINFAAESHVDRSIESSDIFVESNVKGCVCLLEAIRDKKIRYLQVSTDEVYGSLGDNGAFVETMPLEANSPYSASKAAADLFVRAFFHTHKIDAVITRCSNNYGPFQFPEKFIPVVLKQVLANKKIPVYGKGLNVRDWIFVEDHAWGVYLTALKGRAGEAYNFGGFGERANIDLAKKLLSLLGKNSSELDSFIEYVEDRKGHDWRYHIDSQKAQNELGWKPQWSFDEGMQYTVQWYRENFEKWTPLKSI